MIENELITVSLALSALLMATGYWLHDWGYRRGQEMMAKYHLDRMVDQTTVNQPSHTVRALRRRTLTPVVLPGESANDGNY